MKSSGLTSPTNPRIKRTAETRRRDPLQAATVENFNGGVRQIGDYKRREVVMKLQFLLAGIVATGLFASAPEAVAHGGGWSRRGSGRRLSPGRFWALSWRAFRGLSRPSLFRS